MGYTGLLHAVPAVFPIPAFFGITAMMSIIPVGTTVSDIVTYALKGNGIGPIMQNVPGEVYATILYVKRMRGVLMVLRGTRNCSCEWDC